jgi:hypothetical protein
MTGIDDFLAEARELFLKGERGDKIEKLANGEVVDNPQRDNKPPMEYVKAIRFHAINAVFDIWNEQVKLSGEGRDIYIGDLVKPVQDKVKLAIALGSWKWGIPGELTVRRRVEEAALLKHYPESGHPAIVMMDEGFYRPSPFYLSPETRQAIREQVKAAEILA